MKTESMFSENLSNILVVLCTALEKRRSRTYKKVFHNLVTVN
jgi:hypothetical protein